MDPFTLSMMREWAVMATSFAFIGWIIYLTAGLIKRRQQSVMQKHLIDRFASAQDFAQFIQSPAGQKYVAGFTDVVTSPRNSILSSVRTGFVLMFMGMGFLAGANGGWITFRIGWVSFLVGIGFLVSAAVSYFLAKKLGLKEEV
jgi:hypothetical protein